MPARAKLTTNEITQSTISVDNFAIGDEMSHAEMDSNFLNLRDQTFGIVGDDSSGIDVKAGDTIKFLGQGATSVAVIGNQVVISSTDTGGGGGGVTSMRFVGDDSTGVTIGDGETLKITGTQNISVIATQDTVTITGPDLTSYATATSSTAFTNKTGNISQWTNDSAYATATSSTAFTNKTGNISQWTNNSGYLTNSTITIVGDDSTGTTLNTGETLKVAGTGAIETSVSGDQLLISLAASATALTLVGDDSTGSTLRFGDTVKVVGAGTVTTAVVNDVLTITGTGGGGSVGDLTITGSTISSPSNAGITLQPSGAGSIVLDGLNWPQADGTNGQILSTNGAGQLSFITNTASTGDIVFTGNNISTGSTNANLELSAAGTGVVHATEQLFKVGTGASDTFITAEGNTNLIITTNSTASNFSPNSDSATEAFIQIGANGHISMRTQGDDDIYMGCDQVLFGKVTAPNYNADCVLTAYGHGDLTLTTNGTGGSAPFIKINKMTFNATAAGDIDISPRGGNGSTARINFKTTTQTGVGANGAATALTANPVGYMKVKINDTEYQIPYYNV